VKTLRFHVNLQGGNQFINKKHIRIQSKVAASKRDAEFLKSASLSSCFFGKKTPWGKRHLGGTRLTPENKSWLLMSTKNLSTSFFLGNNLKTILPKWWFNGDLPW